MIIHAGTSVLIDKLKYILSSSIMGLNMALGTYQSLSPLFKLVETDVKIGTVR